MILRACVRCGRITEHSLCPDHRKTKDKRPSAAKRGYDAKWRKTRKGYLISYPWCSDCGAKATDVDHIDGLGPKGPMGHDWSNLRSYCHSCHSRRTARDQGPGTKGRSKTGTFIVLVGKSGTGKSSVRAELAPRLGYVSLGPDDFMGRWDTLIPRLDQVPHAVVECVRVNDRLLDRIRSRKATVVSLTAPQPLIEKRLSKRGEVRDTIEERLRQSQGSNIRPDHVVPTENRTPLEVAEEVMERVGGAPG